MPYDSKVIVPLSSEVNCIDVINQLIQSDSQASYKITETGTYALESTRFKAKYNFLLPNPFNTNGLLDAIKVMILNQCKYKKLKIVN